MPEKYLKDTDVGQRFGVHRSTIWRWSESASGFPGPVEFSAGCTRWKLSDIEAWESSKSESKAP